MRWFSVLLALAISAQAMANADSPDSNEQSTARPISMLANLPLSFEDNAGQFDQSIRFVARGRHHALQLGAADASLVLRRPLPDHESPPNPRKSRHQSDSRRSEKSYFVAGLRMALVGANPKAASVGVEPLPGMVNYFIGNDPDQWRTGIPTFAKVRYENVYPGIALLYYGNGRQLEYDFIVAPGADPSRIKIRFEGADTLSITDNGDLVADVAGSEVRWHKPLSYQVVGAITNEVASRYVLNGKNLIGFELGDYDRSQSLVIDPILVYGTFYGGSGFDGAYGVAVDASGNAYIAGDASSVNLPVANAFRGTNSGGADVFVAKFNSTGSSLLYGTYLGGGDEDYGNGIAVDAAGNAYVVGYTISINFPTRNAYQSTFNGFVGTLFTSPNAFLTKIGPVGTNILYSTYFGGLNDTIGWSVALGTGNEAHVAGQTFTYRATGGTIPFPIKNAFQSTPGGGGTGSSPDTLDAFVAKFNTTTSGEASLIYSSYLGGSSDEYGYGIAVDNANNVYVVGQIDSTAIFPAPPTSDFPVNNALQPQFNLGSNDPLGGSTDGFLTKVNAAGSARVFSTFLGGSDDDAANAVAVDSSGNVYVTGQTRSTDLPTRNAQQPEIGGAGFTFAWDAFVYQIASPGSPLLYGTFFGGSIDEIGRGIGVDTNRTIYVGGTTTSFDLPVTVGTYQPTNGTGFFGSFAAKFNPVVPGPSGLVFSTYVAGDGGDDVQGLAVDANSSVYISGLTDSFSDFPVTPGSFQTTNRGGFGDAFLVKFASPVDLSVANIVSTNMVIVGSNLNYTVHANNNGRVQFTSVVVTNILPAALQLLNASSAFGNVTVNGNTIVWTLGVLTNNAAATMTVNTRTLIPLTLTNTATITSTETAAGGEPNTGNNVASPVTIIRGVADVTLTAHALPNPAPSTTNVTFLVGVTNKGPNAASAIVVSNSLPATATFISAQSTMGTCFTNDTGVICEITNSLAVGEGALLTIVVGTPLTAQNWSSVARVSAFELDTLPGNNSFTNFVSVVPLADLAFVSQTGLPNPVVATSNLTYVLTVNNSGPSAAPSVVLSDTLPAGATFVSSQTSQGSSSQAGGVVTANLGTLVAGAQATVTIVCRPTVPGLATNTAVLQSTALELTPANNTSVLVNTVTPQADLGVSMTGPPTVLVASNFTYTVTVTNRGPTAATSIVLNDPLPPNTVFVAAQSAQFSSSFAAGTVTSTLGSLASGTSAILVITVKPTFEGVITNTATVSSSTPDVLAANNSALVTTTVQVNPLAFFLQIDRSGTNVLLHWSANAAGYTLQSKSALSGGNWNAVSNTPALVGNRWFVTNTATSVGGYYRLFRPAPPPNLSIAFVSPNIVLSWPEDGNSYVLLRSAALVPANWQTNAIPPVLVGDRYYVTNTAVPSGEFFRLIR